MTRWMILVLALFSGCCGGGLTEPTPASGKHLIYLHGRIIEDQGSRPTHPQFGVYEYREILDALSDAGFEVSSDQRPRQTNPAEYARITASRVRRLVDGGVAPEDITVVGFSKGGAIAVLTALELDDPRINFVFIACCGPWIEDLFTVPGSTIKGRMLSIHEASDTVGSCDALFDHASPDSTVVEIELHLGGGHGAFYRPHTEWIEPVSRWARGEEPGSVGNPIDVVN